MTAPQNNKNKKKSRGGLLWLVIVVLLSFGGKIMETIGDLFERSIVASDAVIGFAVFAGIIVVLIAVIAAKEKRNKNAGNVQMQRATELLKQNMHKAVNKQEEAVSCQHETGVNRYISQLDEFLKNGIIEKEEYNIMRQKYENLNIADDYH